MQIKLRAGDRIALFIERNYSPLDAGPEPNPPPKVII